MKALVLLMGEDGDLLTSQMLDLEEGSGHRLVWMSNQSRPEPSMVMETDIKLHHGAKAEELRYQIQESILQRRDIPPREFKR